MTFLGDNGEKKRQKLSFNLTAFNITCDFLPTLAM